MTQTTQTTGHLQPEQLNAFIDCELSGAEAQDIHKHLDGCHSCALRVLTATRLKAAAAQAGKRFAPPAEALARLTAQLHPQKRARGARVIALRRSSFVNIAAWTAIAAAILVVVSVAAWHRVRQSNALAANALTAELLDQHLAMLSSAATPQVVSTDRHTVKPWFEGRLPFSFNLPDPDALPPDTTLRGADLVYIEGRPAALLIFTIHKHEVSVFVTQSAGSFVFEPRAARSGFAFISVAAGELRLTAVSDVNPTELNALVMDLARIQ
jgi:anti-sigma factor RsiW